MKNLTIITAALIGGIALPSLAFAETKTINGCEVVKVENANYFNKVDPTCVFSNEGKSGSGALYPVLVSTLRQIVEDSRGS